MTTTGEAQKRFAASPFDDSKADLILRSSDGVYFCTYKLLLSLVSPVFATMFELPTDGMQEIHDDRVCIGVDDDSEALSQVLHWCDPRCTPTIRSLEDVEMMLQVADKYDMETIKERFVHTMGYSHDVFTQGNAFELYGLAVQYQIPDLARLSAKMTLHFELEERSYFHGLKLIPASALYHLDTYYFACGRAAQQTINEEFSIINDLFGQVWDNVGCCGVTGVNRGDLGWKFWVVEHMDRASQELRRTPIPDVLVNPNLIAEAQIRAGACSTCRGDTSHVELWKFSQSLADKVEQAVSKVSLVLEF